MSDVFRCPSCGASNAAGASWCGQCLTRFDAAPPARTEPEAPAGSVPSAPPQPDAPAHPPPAPDLPPVRAVPPASGGVHRRGDDLMWTCPACESVNDMSHTSCPVCGTTIATLFGVTKQTGPKRTGPLVLALSAVLPGAGHGYAGRTGDAIARGVLFVWTTTIGILLMTRTSARGAGVFRAIGAVFIITAAGTWLITMLEAQRLARGDDEPLIPGKALLWASAALTGLLFVGLAAGARAR